MLTELKLKGVLLSDNGGKLRVETDIPLTDEQRTFIREHKSELLAELKAANQSSPVERLRHLAGKYRLDPDEVTNWYSQDHGDIQSMDDLTLDAMVRDYVCNRPTFRKEQPYRTYTLWFYRLDENDLGYVRQGLMTSDPEQALHQLEDAYGVGNVFGLHKSCDSGDKDDENSKISEKSGI